MVVCMRMRLMGMACMSVVMVVLAAASAVVMGMCMPVIVVVVLCVAVSVVAVAIIGHMAAVGTAFRLKRHISLHHGHVHAAKHVGQHMIGLNFQVIGLQLNRHMAVAQVVGGTHQIKRAAMRSAGRDVQHFLWCCNDAHHEAILGHQHITTAHSLATGQENGQLTALAVCSCKA